jgi:pSer/pThr/pTyr-binding forkhead associated (FHA) protein
MSPDLVLLLLRFTIAIALYAFLAYILIQLWKDIRSSRGSRSSAPKAHLETIEGGDLEPLYDLGELNLIGRASDNTIILKDNTVSGYHARISFQQAQWWLEDLGSRNGSLLNDIPVTEPLVITYGDEVQFGNIRMRLVSEIRTEDIPTQEPTPSSHLQEIEE